MERRGISLTMWGVLIAAAGVVAPIAWDIWSKRSEVSITAKQAATILQADGGIEKLKIMYDGKQIEALSKTTLLLKNSGRTPISKDDVISPVAVQFGGEILDASLVRESPIGLGASILRNEGSVAVLFSLLNPGDEIEFSVLSSGAIPKYTASARIKNIREISVVESKRQIDLRSKIGLVVYIVGFLSAFFYFASVSLMIDVGKKRSFVKRFVAGESDLRIGVESSALRNLVKDKLTFLLPRDKNLILNEINSANFPLSDEAYGKLEAMIFQKINSMNDVGGAVLTALIAVAGTVYVVQSVLL